MASGSITLKKKPEAPVRLLGVKRSKEIGIRYVSAKSIIEALEAIEPGIARDDIQVNVEIEEDYYGGGSIVCIASWSADETDDELALRMKEYEKKKKEYDTWYSKHKTEILIALNAKHIRLEEEKRATKMKKERQLKAAIQKSQKELEKLQK